MKTTLTPEQIQSYRKDGFLLIEDFLDQEELALWRTSVYDAQVIVPASSDCSVQGGLVAELARHEDINTYWS